RKTLFGQADSWLHDFGPFEFAVLRLGQLKAADRAGDTCRTPAFEASASELAAGIEVHVAGGFRGGLLAEVDEGGSSVGHADDHVSAAAEVAGEGVGGD